MLPSSRKRLLRSILFIPGDRKAIFEKAVDKLESDAVIFDLEDAVGCTSKDAARENVFKYLAEFKSNKQKEIIVRINSALTPAGKEDLLMLKTIKDKVNAILLPKVDDTEVIKYCANVLGSKSSNRDLWAMIETAKGVINSDMIAASPQIDALIFGSNDLTKDLKAKHDAQRSPLLYSMSKVVVSARAYEKWVIDGVHIDIADTAGLVRSCIQGKSLGFDGKSLIHPSQISAANAHFSPTDDDHMHASKIIDAFRQAQLDGKGVCVVDGKLVENLHADEAQEIIDIVNAIDARKRGQ